MTFVTTLDIYGITSRNFILVSLRYCQQKWRHATNCNHSV